MNKNKHLRRRIRKPARPSATANREFFVEFLGIRVATVTLASLLDVADRTGRSLSEVVRLAIERGLKRIKR